MPLDPEHPAERIQTILRLAQASIVLTTGSLTNQLTSILDNTSVASHTVDYNKLVPSVKPSIASINRGDICHVLFTSGTTGVPKGMGVLY